MTALSESFSGGELMPSRRDVVKYGTAAVLSAAIVPLGRAFAADSGSVSGIVYENRSGGVHRQASDPGIAGVLV